MVEYYFYNTDARAITGQPRPRFPVLVEKGFAAAGGDRKKYGEQLAQLELDDVLLMYENRVGVVAVGRVRERWDGRSHTKPLYYRPDEMLKLSGSAYEYRIKVNWFPAPKPISLKDLRQRFGSPDFTPRGVIQKILKHRSIVEGIVKELQTAVGVTPTAVDLAAPASKKVKTTTYRILRDTAVAKYVKDLHDYKCQICGHTIVLAGGYRYAEAHHIRPLGGGHNGPDVIGNILCVCPNHHAELDFGASRIRLASLHCASGHTIEPEYVAYHNDKIYGSAGC